MAEVDEVYEEQLRNHHQLDRVANGIAGHGPCDVCFLLARLAGLRTLIANVSACYEGRFDAGGAHVFIPADLWNAVKDADHSEVRTG